MKKQSIVSRTVVDRNGTSTSFYYDVTAIRSIRFSHTKEGKFVALYIEYKGGGHGSEFQGGYDETPQRISGEGAEELTVDILHVWGEPVPKIFMAGISKSAKS